VSRYIRAMESWASEMQSSDLSLVTIMLAKTDRLTWVNEMVEKFRKDFRNCRAARVKQNPRWASVSARGHFEVDAVLADDAPLFGPQWREMFCDLAAVIDGSGDDVLWVPHVHLVVHHPGLDWQEIRDVFRERWAGFRRVDVTRFHKEGTATENAGDVAGYSLKSHAGNRFLGLTAPWPVEWSAAYWAWIWEHKAALRCLSMSMNPMGVRGGKDVDSEEDWTIDDEFDEDEDEDGILFWSNAVLDRYQVPPVFI
jgi:hypothetical protein